MSARRQSLITNHQSQKMPLLIAGILALGFFVLGIATLKDYGINWDEPIHFSRGQAYLYYLTTGKTEYENLPPYVVRGKVFDEEGKPTKEEAENTAHRSVFQNPAQPPSYWLQNDGGHPPLNGILAAVSNRVFYQDLHLLGDIDSYHLFEVLIAALLVGLVFLWGAQAYGLVAGWAAALALGTYPLFFGESHFNIKDPIVTFFFTLTLYLWWRGSNEHKPKWFGWAGLCFGAGLGTKLNIIFAPLTLLIWLVVRLGVIPTTLHFFKNRRVLWAIGGGLLAGLGLFFLTWPYLWHDTLMRLGSILTFYREVGGDTGAQVDYVGFLGLNSYPLIWIVRTTPEIVLFFGAVGIAAAIGRFFKKDTTALLWLVWLIVAIGRVSVPGASIYGGVRQIIEFVPALALLTGVGVALTLELLATLLATKILRDATVGVGIALLLFGPVIAIDVRVHPNENVYFNSISGGLPRAIKEKLPAAGNSYGNAFAAAVEWLNQNAELNAQLALPVSTASSLPIERLRPDIVVNDVHFSGPLRFGEYVVELSYVGFPPPTFATDYLALGQPIYEEKVEGIPLVKIWRNDEQHFPLPGLRRFPIVVSTTDSQTFTMTLPDVRRVWSITFQSFAPCAGDVAGHFSVLDPSGATQRFGEATPVKQLTFDSPKDPHQLFYRIAGKQALAVSFSIDDAHGCAFAPESAILETSD